MENKDKIKKILESIVKEEFKGFKKDQNFKLKPEETGFEKVAYLPKFDKIRREIKKASAEFKPYKVSVDQDIAELASDITKTFNQIGQMIYMLDQNLRQKGIK